jgi:hypothetical protein
MRARPSFSSTLPTSPTRMPATRIDRYRRGGFYGDMRTHHRETPPETYDQPICWLPHAVDNAAGGQIWIPEGSWGPLGGEILHLSWGRCRLFVLLREQIEDQWQGGVVRLPCDQLLSGPITGAFHPGDGHLYVVGLHGWQTAAQKDGCLQRIRYTAKKMYLPIELNSYPDGISLSFTQPLDPESARDRGRYQVEQWNYRYSGDYGSDHWSVREPDRQGHDRLRIDEVLLSEDGYRVFLKIPDLRPAMQTEIRYDLRADDGTRVTDAIYHTIHQFQQHEEP